MDNNLRQRLGIRKDRNASHYTGIDFYKYYIETTEVNYHIVNKDVYQSIIEDYFKYLAEELLSGKQIHLPARLGDVIIIKHQPANYDKKSLAVDYKATKELKKVVYHLNEHSNGFKFRCFWKKIGAHFTFKTRYQLRLVRDNKRRLAQIIKNREQDFLEK